ncbi:MAG: isoprenylcysteine carboxylmethyltransferase family protein [Pseudomonadota bacterium]
MLKDHVHHLRRLTDMAGAALRPPPGAGRIAAALTLGVVVHVLFAAAVLAMMLAMAFGMSRSLGAVPWPWAGLANVALVVQFPLVHSFLLTGRGGKLLARLWPGAHGGTVASSTFALIASAQLLALFALWTPTGIVWWQADGALWWGILAVYGLSWVLVVLTTWDAGIEVQSGALGWMSLLARRKPVYPDMPETGTFRVVRQPIYLSFALTLWLVPTWTPDQLFLALCYTAYCVLAPRRKEARFAARYGDRFAAYRARTPYMNPFARRKDVTDDQPQQP